MICDRASEPSQSTGRAVRAMGKACSHNTAGAASITLAQSSKNARCIPDGACNSLCQLSRPRAPPRNMSVATYPPALTRTPPKPPGRPPQTELHTIRGNSATACQRRKLVVAAAAGMAAVGANPQCAGGFMQLSVTTGTPSHTRATGAAARLQPTQAPPKLETGDGATAKWRRPS